MKKSELLIPKLGEEPFKVAIDFDGTICLHDYPGIGKKVPGAFKWMKLFQKAGAYLILWTMRSGELLIEAETFCRQNGVFFDSCNEGIGDREWTQSPKVFAHRYIDDAAYGCPLVYDTHASRPYVDWEKAGPAVLEMIELWQEGS